MRVGDSGYNLPSYFLNAKLTITSREELLLLRHY